MQRLPRGVMSHGKVSKKAMMMTDDGIPTTMKKFHGAGEDSTVSLQKLDAPA